MEKPAEAEAEVAMGAGAGWGGRRQRACRRTVTEPRRGWQWYWSVDQRWLFTSTPACRMASSFFSPSAPAPLFAASFLPRIFVACSAITSSTVASVAIVTLLPDMSVRYSSIRSCRSLNIFLPPPLPPP